MNDFLSTPIEFLKGVGPQRAELLKKELNIHTFEQLLNHFPFRYIDKSFYNTISELPYIEGYTQLKGRIVGIDDNQKGKQKRLTVKFQDHTGIIELTWFQGIKWIKPSLQLHREYTVTDSQLYRC
jgi:ATP-dependent DNA helicase RecG